ncbi:helix-turn-helix domain-containing protein [bacterium]|nr:helix-turn-helix domain-containing protein [bacterium]
MQKDGIELNADAYKVDQAAKVLDLGEDTIRRYIREGKLEAKKVGKEWYISRPALEKLIGLKK